LIEGRYYLQITVQGHEDAVFRITMRDRLVIGRSHEQMDQKPDVDLVAFDAQTKGVSRQHAALLKEDDMLKIVDLGSTNGTFLNGTRMSPNQPRILRDGDELRLGRLTLTVAFVKA
jgi:pSer/pThr/pTyr-binding forkhead associated (FHA) protein